MRVALLADRPRVEERLLLDALAQRGVAASLLPPERVHLPLAGPPSGEARVDLALDRGPATPERAVLAALLAAAGALVVNRAATTRLLADRLALLRHLTIAEVPVPETAVSFGEEATLAAIEEMGYPVVLKPLAVDPRVPLALVEDRDAAEAIVEHRTTLGHERAVLVQRVVPGRWLRLVVIGREVVGIETRALEGWRPGRAAPYQPFEGEASALAALGERVVGRLGSGVYQVEVSLGDGGPVVTGAGNLVDFRSLAERGVDVADRIAAFALAQASGAAAAAMEGNASAGTDD